MSLRLRFVWLSAIVPTRMVWSGRKSTDSPLSSLITKSFLLGKRSRELVKALHAHGVELVVLAGFMRVLTSSFIRNFPQHIVNIHPALLPAFPGTHGQRQALQYGVKIAGATVHFVDEQTDHGPIIAQAAVPVYPDDTEESLSTRILAQEHKILPYAIQLFAEGRLEICDRAVIIHNAPRSADAALRVPESP